MYAGILSNSFAYLRLKSVFPHYSAPYNGLYRFPLTINGTAVEMLFTSVSGHLMELEFTEQYTSWRGCSPLDLYNAPVVKRVPQVCGLGAHCCHTCQCPTRFCAHTGQATHQKQLGTAVTRSTVAHFVARL